VSVAHLDFLEGKCGDWEQIPVLEIIGEGRGGGSDLTSMGILPLKIRRGILQAHLKFRSAEVGPCRCTSARQRPPNPLRRLCRCSGVSAATDSRATRTLGVSSWIHKPPFQSEPGMREQRLS